MHLHPDKKIVESFIRVLENLKSLPENRVVIIKFSELYEHLTAQEKKLAERLLALDPEEYGISGNYLGMPPIPENLVKIDPQTYSWKEEEKTIASQYLPKNVFLAYSDMRKFMKKDLGKGILVKSGYRSPAYQLLTFVFRLYKNDCDLNATMKSVALPGYSEHHIPSRQAIDFITEDGIINGEEASFDETKEYEWMQENAKKCGFELSYPKNNKEGIMFEPWHWRFSPAS